MQTNRQVAILASIFVIVHRKISTVDLGKEFDESSPYITRGPEGPEGLT